MVVGMIDSIMVSSAGEAAVSGVSLIDTVMVLIIYLFSAMAAGGAVVAGQYLGGGDKTNAKKAAGELVWINGLISIAVTVLVFILSGWIVGNLFGDIAEDVAASAGITYSIRPFPFRPSPCSTPGPLFSAQWAIPNHYEGLPADEPSQLRGQCPSHLRLFHGGGRRGNFHTDSPVGGRRSPHSAAAEPKT